MDNETMDYRKCKRLVEDSLMKEFEQTLPERAQRFLQVKPLNVCLPTTIPHFVYPYAECTLLYRDGYFYGSIALTQAAAEALVRVLCEKNSFRPSDDFEKNLTKLTKRNFISDNQKESLFKIWERRNYYHHLNKGIAQDQRVLEDLALEKIRLLNEVLRGIFNYTIADNEAMRPKNIKYWK